ncbi:hypothetical protein MEO40_17765 [Dolichospermum sp. ST_sed1]|nr:hypothetical protein [Dolichospermum sp. ST_sed1]
MDIRFDNTQSVKALAKRTVLSTPRGNEKQYLKAGDIVKAGDKCTYIPGCIGKVVKVYDNNGFVRCDINWFFDSKKKANIQSEKQSELIRI